MEQDNVQYIGVVLSGMVYMLKDDTSHICMGYLYCGYSRGMDDREFVMDGVLSLDG